MTSVTAIVSAYYAEQFILDRIYNLQEQKPEPEIIVVCQRNSPEEAIASCFDIKIITTEDIPSIAKAWNLGIHIAGGDYITNANSDDKLYPYALAQMADVLDIYPEIGVVFGNCDICIPGEPAMPWKRARQTTGEYDASELLRGRYIIGPMPMWRRELGLFDENFIVAQDYEFFARLAYQGVRFWYINRSLGCYLKRQDSNEWKHKGLCAEEHERIKERYADRK